MFGRDEKILCRKDQNFSFPQGFHLNIIHRKSSLSLFAYSIATLFFSRVYQYNQTFMRKSKEKVSVWFSSFPHKRITHFWYKNFKKVVHYFIKCWNSSWQHQNDVWVWETLSFLLMNRKFTMKFNLAVFISIRWKVPSIFTISISFELTFWFHKFLMDSLFI